MLIINTTINIKIHYDDKTTAEFSVTGHTFNDIKNYYLDQIFISSKWCKNKNKLINSELKCVLVEEIL